MRQSHSHSKRDLLETCPRRYFYEYYASSLKEQPPSLGASVQKMLFDDEPTQITTRMSHDRIAFARQLKQLSGCFLLAGDTVQPTATTNPCMLVARDGVDVRRPTQAFFALSQMNYSTPGKAHRYAQPLRETDAQLQRRTDQDMRGIK